MKRFYKQKRSSSKKLQDYKDGSGLQFSKFDFLAGGQEIKNCNSGEILSFQVVMLSFFNISLRLSLLAICFSYFKLLQQAPDHNLAGKQRFFSWNINVPLTILFAKTNNVLTSLIFSIPFLTK